MCLRHIKLWDVLKDLESRQDLFQYFGAAVYLSLALSTDRNTYMLTMI
jgi:hypothetical protein